MLVAIGVDIYGTLVDPHEVSLHLHPLVGDLAEKMARHTARLLIPTCRHEVHTAFDLTSSAAQVRVTRKYKFQRLPALCATIGYL
jgi:hypothetical protein